MAPMALSPQDLIDIETLLKRKPTIVEHHIFEAMWSEHCSYKSSKELLKKYLPVNGPGVVLGVGEDAGIIDFATHDGVRYGLVVAHESHNHPSQILPVEGAATGVGGVVRDVYCMGADVIGVLNSIHFGIDANNEDGPATQIAREVVLGISDYANPLGVPVLGGETAYHPCFNDNCLVNVAALGIVPIDHIIRSRVPEAATHEPYDVILIGKSTDSTGFGGAAFSSATLDAANDMANMGAVQVHDPFLKRVIAEAIKALFKRVAEKQIPIGFKDLGAGGIACATSEIAVAGGFGVRVNLNAVNMASDTLPPEVIAASETQERFCLVVPRTFSHEVLHLFNTTFDLPAIYHKAGAAIIGEVIPENRYILTHNDQEVCNLPVEAITTEVKAVRTARSRTITRTEHTPEWTAAELEAACEKMVGLHNQKSKRYVYQRFDNAVRGDTILYPGEGDAVVVAPIEGCKVGAIASIDSNLYGALDPYTAGAYAVAEAIRNVIAVGGVPLAATDCLNYGNPENPDVFFDLEEGIKGIADACWKLSLVDGEPLPIVSGNVSLYNESANGTAVLPSPVIMVVGKILDYRRAVPLQLNRPDLKLILIGARYAEFGATQAAHFFNAGAGAPPQVRFEEENAANRVMINLLEDGLVDASHDISSGGLWSTLCEMVFGERGDTAVGIRLAPPANVDLATFLFSENGGYVIAISESRYTDVIQRLNASKAPFFEIGQTTTALTIKITNTSFEFPVSPLVEAWQATA